MRRPLVTLALALCLVACGPLDQQVPLLTDATVAGGPGCVLAYQVVDVIADPATGMPVVKGGGDPLRWPRGYTARRAGSEVVVLDPAGRVVLTTGGRYWMCPAQDDPEWVIGNVKPCPEVPDDVARGYDCELGGGVR
jgi:hypothetical protein